MPAPNSVATFRRVPTPLLIVGGLHLAVVWALLDGLQVHNAPLQRPGAIVADVIDRPPLAPEKPLPRPFQPHEIHFTEPPLRSVVVEGPSEPAASDGIFAEIPPPAIESRGPGGSAEPEPAISSAGIDLRHPLTQPPYPMSSRRVGEEGAIVIDILVGVDGRVRDAKVSRSSGFERLDQAALSEAKQHWRLKPAARNGVPFEQWLTLKVVFRLEDR